jgi:hypothetical protein
MHIFLTKKQSRLEIQFPEDYMDNLRTNLRTNWMLLSQTKLLQGIGEREHLTFNQVVRGSSPRRPTSLNIDFISKKWFSPISPNPKTRAYNCVQMVNLRTICVQIERREWQN